MIASQTHEETRNYYEDWLNFPRLLKKGTRTNTFVVGSSPRFNVYGNDFGWGKPVAARGGLGNKFDGKLTIFPGVEEGSIEIEIRLTPQALHAMEKDVEFMKVVTVN
ncbi:HXXXD-type acyl-transferase family protein [Abeliophyllum distichum]|uniref:HXXXD-type acyl-transferase family protein n=1 Tax=Abeliophyllum distichum TaxID=126358 RepID=A0ABD1SG04_9LAMI